MANHGGSKFLKINHVVIVQVDRACDTVNLVGIGRNVEILDDFAELANGNAACASRIKDTESCKREGGGGGCQN